MRKFATILRTLAVLLASVAGLRAVETGVLVYGATPAGIAAALAAARDGERVLLVEPSERIGGMITCGLSHTDFRTREGLTGAYLEFAKQVEQHYRETYGADSQQLRDSWGGVFAEPKVNLAIFEKMLAAEPNITVWRNRKLFSVRSSGDEASRAIGMAAFLEPNRQTVGDTVSADVFIDATYEGDLIAAAKVPYRVGREGRAEYDESLAPEQADAQLQAYNFRLVATREPANRAPVRKPQGYKREEFAGVLPLFASGKLKTIFGYPSGILFKAQTPPLPNGKYDLNDVSAGTVRLSLPGENLDWPDGGGGAAVRESGGDTVVPYSPTGLGQARQRVFDAHLLWNVGLLYFLQNDDAVPAKLRTEAREWGWCRDEFDDNGHLPPQLYVREARRMIGAYVFTEHDTAHAPGDARAVLRSDAIAMGDYGSNCHGTAHDGSRFGGKHTGEFYKSVSPYQIPYGVLVAKGVENLLAPGPVSASHVGFCALRLEPIWMSLGQAAGHAAHLARAARTTVQRVSVADLQKRLHTAGGATIYVSDVPPGHADFAAVQWWGTAGGLHGLAPMPAKPGQRGKNLHGQYYEAYPGHAAELDKLLDDGLATAWLKLAAALRIDAATLPKADGTITRRDFIRAAFAAR
ncbi:MAG: FAD-dependent oxidoreductase [Chthoniobacteraceae bacterium]